MGRFEREVRGDKWQVKDRREGNQMRGFLAVFHSGLPNNNHAVTAALIRSPKYLHSTPCELGFHSPRACGDPLG